MSCTFIKALRGKGHKMQKGMGWLRMLVVCALIVISLNAVCSENDDDDGDGHFDRARHRGDDVVRIIGRHLLVESDVFVEVFTEFRSNRA